MCPLGFRQKSEDLNHFNYSLNLSHMKRFILLSIFMIGMMIMWPPGEQVKATTTDQVCIVIDQPTVTPVCAVMVPVQEKGGGFIVQCYNSVDVLSVLTESGGELMIDRTIISPPKSANSNKVYARRLNKVSHPPLNNKYGCKRNKVSIDMVRIRADTSIG